MLFPKHARSAFLRGILDGWELRGETEDEVSGKVILAMSGRGTSLGLRTSPNDNRSIQGA